MTDETPPRKLTRSGSDTIIGGVASGLGRYFGVDPILFRIGFVVLAFVGAAGILAYLALLAFVPSDGEQREGGTGAKAIGVAGTIVLAIALVTFLSPPLFLFGPGLLVFALIGLAGVLLWRALGGNVDGDPARTIGRIALAALIAVGILGAALGVGLAAALGGGVVIAILAVVAGFALIGTASAVSLLIRTAAGDMYPPARRARGISYVLVGSVFGAILGPTVFSPLFAGKHVDAGVLTVPWLAAAVLSLGSAATAWLVRPDTKQIAELIGSRENDVTQRGPSAPLAEILRRPGVIQAMLASFASFGVMVSVMNLTGYVVVEIHHHAQDRVFPIIGAHVLGMYALVLVVGALIDRIGRRPALSGGLLVMGASTLGLAWVTGVPATALLLFGLGIGWNISYVAAAAQMADLTRPWERGRLFGFNDFAAALLGASLALVGGLTLEVYGVAALAVGATLLVTAPAPWVFRRPAEA
jgi:phage shock protein PspC (stress-responsive transcriptional regulator)/MFS family permease